MAYRIINSLGPLGVPIVMTSPISINASDFSDAFKQAIKMNEFMNVQNMIIHDHINNVYRRANIDYETRANGTRAKIRHSTVPYSMVAPLLVPAPPLVPFAQVISDKPEEKKGESSTGATQGTTPGEKKDEGNAKIMFGHFGGIHYVPGKDEARQQPGAFLVGPRTDSGRPLIPVNGAGIVGVPGAVGVAVPAGIPVGYPYPVGVRRF